MLSAVVIPRREALDDSHRAVCAKGELGQRPSSFNGFTADVRSLDSSRDDTV